MSESNPVTLGFAVFTKPPEDFGSWKPNPLSQVEQEELPVLTEEVLSGLRVALSLEVTDGHVPCSINYSEAQNDVMKLMETYLFKNPELYKNCIPVLATDRVIRHIKTFEQCFEPIVAGYGFSIFASKSRKDKKVLHRWEIAENGRPVLLPETQWKSAAGLAFEKAVCNRGDKRIFVIKAFTLTSTTKKKKPFRVFTVGEIDGFYRKGVSLLPMEIRTFFGDGSHNKLRKIDAKCRTCDIGFLVVGICPKPPDDGNPRKYDFSLSSFNMSDPSGFSKLKEVVIPGRENEYNGDIQQERLQEFIKIFVQQIDKKRELFYINGSANGIAMREKQRVFNW